MAKKKLFLVFGGKSGEHEVSIQSAASIYQALNPAGYEITLIAVDKKGTWLHIDSQQFTKKVNEPRSIHVNQMALDEIQINLGDTKDKFVLKKSKKSLETDIIFSVIHGTNGEDGTIQGLFDLLQVPYVGAGVLGSAVAMDKDVSKRLLRDAGIPIVQFVTLKKHEFNKRPTQIIKEIAVKLGYPFFVKPANTGSSVGVHKVKNETEALSKFEDAFSYDVKILVEQGIDAREIECSVLGNDEPQASILGEIIPRHEFYSYEAKYLDDNGAELKIPADTLDKMLSDKIRQLAIDTYKVLECTGMARVDFFIDRKTNKVYLNEINTLPGFTKISMYPKMWDATGLSYPKLLDKLVDLGIERFKQRSSIKTDFID